MPNLLSMAGAVRVGQRPLEGGIVGEHLAGDEEEALVVHPVVTEGTVDL